MYKNDDELYDDLFGPQTSKPPSQPRLGGRLALSQRQLESLKCRSAKSNAIAYNIFSEKPNSLLADNGTPKRKQLSLKTIVSNDEDSSKNMTQKGDINMLARTIRVEETPGTEIKMSFNENDTAKHSHSFSLRSSSEHVGAKRICRKSGFDEPLISSPSVADHKFTSSQNKNQCPSLSHFASCLDQCETSHEGQLNVSDDLFLPLELSEDFSEQSNLYGAKLCVKNSMDDGNGCYVNTKMVDEVARYEDSAMLKEKLACNKFWVEKSETLSSCTRSQQQVQQPTTSFFTGAASATLQTAVGAKKSDNKDAWASIMAMMRPSAAAKKPVRTSAIPQKMVAQTPRAKPVGGNDATTAKKFGSLWKPKGNRPCPFYKKIPGTGFAVDAFSYGTIPGVTSYFLSHFHSDHYIGLKASFNLPIYCTSITASLVQLNIRVKSQFLNILPMNEPYEIEGVRVTALDANHCPGSAMLLFQLRSGTNILHVGDFRATPSMEHLHVLSGLRISQLYLDTTYCDAKYDFPTQEDAVAKAVQLVLDHLHKHPRTVVVCGTYLIGKEKLFLGVADALDCRIWALPPKAKILRLLQDPFLTERLVDDPLAATVHAVSMRLLNLKCLQSYLAQYSQQFSHILALKPSGWEFSRGAAPFTRENVTIAGVPYSEHSSFSELARFVKFIRPCSIIPTVNVGSAQSRQAMQRHFESWLPSLQKH